jgi:hypothetical protein
LYFKQDLIGKVDGYLEFSRKTPEGTWQKVLKTEVSNSRNRVLKTSREGKGLALNIGLVNFVLAPFLRSEYAFRLRINSFVSRRIPLRDEPRFPVILGNRLQERRPIAVESCKQSLVWAEFLEPCTAIP